MRFHNSGGVQRTEQTYTNQSRKHSGKQRRSQQKRQIPYRTTVAQCQNGRRNLSAIMSRRTACRYPVNRQFTAPGKAGIRNGSLQYFMELLTPSTAQVLSKYEHRYWGKYAAVTQNRYGRGSAFYIGCYTDKEFLKNLYRKVWQAGETGSGTRTAEGSSWPVIIREGRNRLGRRVAYVLNYSEEDTVAACPFPKCRDLITGTEYRKEERVTLKDWGVLVLEEE